MDNVEMYEVVKEDLVDCYNQMEVSTPKKRKSKAQDNPSEKPKKPRSAYLLYYFDVHQAIQQEVPNIPQSEINKRISESWKRLSVAEKAYYLEKAKSEKEGVDTSSPSPSKDLPGFRKILPRASYVLLSKSSPSKTHFGTSDDNVELVDMPDEGGSPPDPLSQDPQLTHLGLANEVELSVLPIVNDDSAEETAAAEPPMKVQRTPPFSSLSLPSKVVSTDPRVSAELTTNTVTVRENETKASGSGFVWTMVQQVRGDPTQVLAIIPSQGLLQPKADVKCMAPLMMVSVGAKVGQSVKPSYKMSVKTYTRRGRGQCLNPECSFVYVTRHKPPTCPECRTSLGGKLNPTTKKTKEKTKTSHQPPPKAESNPDESIRPTELPAQGGNADDGKTNASESKKEGLTPRGSRNQRAVPEGRPVEGSINKTREEQPTQLRDHPKVTTVQGRDKSSDIVLKRPVRPIFPAYYNTGRALFQIVTVPSDKGKYRAAHNNTSAMVPRENFSALKPSTLKQLGQTVPRTTVNQYSPVSAPGGQPASSLTDARMNFLSVVPVKQHTISKFDLGLSTARGRGRCKNSSCDYMYKNRHKPEVCPKCGFELSQKNAKGTKSATLLNPYQPLSPTQKEIQRQSTLQLLRRCLFYPENESELQETLSLIQELNGLQIVLIQPGHQEQEESVGTETLVETGWPQFYESAATHCGLCNYPLFKGDQSTVAGQEDCWLLTETLIQTASLQVKVCTNTQCIALHCFTDLHPGLFNIGNKLLVSLDLFLKIRGNIKLGHAPSQAAKTALDQNPNHPVHALSPEELSQIQELLLSGYWAFECLTVRDYNDMICGICGVAPKLEIAQRFTNNVLELKNIEFTWPEYSVSDEVHVDDFWLTMESEALEQAAFPTNIPITRVDASIIAPFIPPLMRSTTVINTEKDKVLSHSLTGNPSVLVRLIHNGQLRLDTIEDHSEEELKAILDSCGVDITPGSTKNELLTSVISLYTLVHSGLSTVPQPPQQLTAGKLSKVCPHKVVSGSKCLVRGETARDHVDLLLSSRYWPPVYVSDCAQQVALCMDLQHPELATQMWSRNQGCFCDPFEKAEFVSCAELQEQPYCADLSLDNLQVHPVTKSSSCWLLHPPGAESSTDLPSVQHHSFHLCRDLEPYVSLVVELGKDKEEDVEKDKSVVFSNAAYYYLYNRLLDFLTSRDIVSQQISQVVKACQPGEVVIRDALYRLGVAQIHTESEEGHVGEGQTQEGGTETCEVVLPEKNNDYGLNKKPNPKKDE